MAHRGLHSLSLRTKLLLGTLLMPVPVVGLLLLAFNASYERRREIVLESLLQTARGAAALLGATFDEAITLGQAVTGEPSIQSLDPALLTPRLRRLGSGYDQYQTFFIFDATGDLIGVSDEVVPASLNIADRRYYRSVMETGQSNSFELVLGRRAGEVTRDVAVPVFGDGDAPIGVLVIGFDLDRLQERIASMGMFGTQSASLFDPAGRLALVAATGSSRSNAPGSGATSRPSRRWRRHSLARRSSGRISPVRWTIARWR